MSERLEHEEGLPTMKLSLPTGEFEATPENASLFHYLGSYAAMSHVFLETGVTEDGKITGSYIFAHSPAFAEMRDFMLQNCFPAAINQRVIPQCDLDAYENVIAQMTTDVEDVIPEGWDEGTSAA